MAGGTLIFWRSRTRLCAGTSWGRGRAQVPGGTESPAAATPGEPAGGARAEEAVGGWGSSRGSPPLHLCAHGFSAPRVPQHAFTFGRPSLQSLAVHASAETGCSLTQFWSLKPSWTLHPSPQHTHCAHPVHSKWTPHGPDCKVGLDLCSPPTGLGFVSEGPDSREEISPRRHPALGD